MVSFDPKCQMHVKGSHSASTAVRSEAELNPKRLELLSELVPQAKGIALLVNPNSAAAEPMIRDVQEVARAKGVQLQILKADAEGDFETAFASLVQLHAGALVVGGDAFFFSRREQLVALAGPAGAGIGSREMWSSGKSASSFYWLLGGKLSG